jgi:gliding motility-associated lipoprotein GldH
MQRETRHSLFIAIVLLFVGATSCSSDAAYRTYTSFGSGWDKATSAHFELPPLSGTHNIFIHLRNDNTYPFSNIFIIAEWEQNNGLLQTDTLEYRMSTPEGAWLGSGMTEVKESKLFWKEKINLYDSLRYTVRLRHALREKDQALGVDTLKGILAVGVAAEKTP